MRRPAGEALWLLALAAFAAIMGALLFSGDILLYLAPRMIPAVWFGLAVLVTLTAHQAVHALRVWRNGGEDRPVRAGTLLFFIPVLLILTGTPNKDTYGTLPNQNVKMLGVASESTADTAQDSASAQPSPEPSEQPDDPRETAQSVQPSAAASSQADVETEGKTQEETADSVEVIDAADALPCVLADGEAGFDVSADLFSDYLYEPLEEMAGRTITLYGFVYKDDSFPEDTILISRLYISCCAADASIVGFHVKVADANAFEEDEWIRVEGTVEAFSLEYCGSRYDFPILTGGTVIRCDEPDAQAVYIYP